MLYRSWTQLKNFRSIWRWILLFYQEKRAFLFCQEDRAILCRDCDLPIHSANQHTGKHIRFLLTGVRLSLSSPAPKAAQPTTCSGKGNGGEIPSINGSTISEYLIKTIPGWHVEDLLQDSIDVASDVNGLSKQVSMEFQFEDLVSIVIDGELSVQKLLGFFI